MDRTRFDALTKALVTRRCGLGLAAALLGVGRVAESDARKHKKKKCKPKCAACRTCKRGKCRPTPNGMACGDGLTCQNGACGCAPGTKACAGRCVPSNQCCGDTDCAAGAPRCCQGACIRTTECCTAAECANGRACQEGTCGCPAGTTTCPEQCCGPAPGFTAFSVECHAGGCICNYRMTDNPGACPGTCQIACGVSGACGQPPGLCESCCS